MKYYVDIVYMIVNGVIISNDKNKNKNIIEMRLKNKGFGLSNVKKGSGSGLSNVKKAQGLKSIKGSGLKILK